MKRVPIVFSSSNGFVKILYVCVTSLIKYFDKNRELEIYILHSDIEEEKQRIFVDDFNSELVKIQFLDVSDCIKNYDLKGRKHFTRETFYRFVILELFSDYSKVLYLDCDLIIKSDVSILLELDIGNNLVGAVLDPEFAGNYCRRNSKIKKYCDNVLKVPYDKYFQGGVMLLNIEELRKVTSCSQLLEQACKYPYKYADQDILNILCRNRVYYLEMSWNVLFDCNHTRWHRIINRGPDFISQNYMDARESPKIIHYAGWLKPWYKPNEDFGNEFWMIARDTRYYEELIYDMIFYSHYNFWTIKHKVISKLKTIKHTIEKN